MDYPTNSDDVIDSRDVIEAIREITEACEAGDLADADLLSSLTDLASYGESLGDWEYGVTLVRDSYFKSYAQELAEDLELIDKSCQWPCYCIDWERAARELQMDYTSIDFDGVTYWGR